MTNTYFFSIGYILRIKIRSSPPVLLIGANLMEEIEKLLNPKAGVATPHIRRCKMAKTYVTFFYSEQKLREGAFKLEMRHGTEMLPRGSVVVGMIQGAAMLLYVPRWLNPDLRPHIEEVVQEAMRDQEVPEGYQITEMKDRDGKPTGELFLLPPIQYVIPTSTGVHLIWVKGKWEWVSDDPRRYGSIQPHSNE